MVDLTENNIMFTLNGEMLISDSGSELAFKDIEIGDGEWKPLPRRPGSPRPLGVWSVLGLESLNPFASCGERPSCLCPGVRSLGVPTRFWWLMAVGSDLAGFPWGG